MSAGEAGDADAVDDADSGAACPRCDVRDSIALEKLRAHFNTCFRCRLCGHIFSPGGSPAELQGGELGSADILKLSLIISVISREARNLKIGEWRAYNDFRFFTPLRCVQNDREGTHSFRNDREGARRSE